MRGRDPWTRDDADRRQLCHDILAAIDDTRRLDNGQPTLWASLDQLGLAAGESVIYVGPGADYYSAIMAEIVGPTGPGHGDRDRPRPCRGKRRTAILALSSRMASRCTSCQ
jgi:hypothetical protein